MSGLQPWLQHVIYICFTLMSAKIFYVCVGFAWQGFDSEGGYRGGSCEKLLEASFMSNRANASQLQDRPTTGQG